MSKSLEIELRRIKSGARRGVGHFNNDREIAIPTLATVYYHGNIPESEQTLLREYWEINFKYRKTNNWDEFIENSRGFYEKLDTELKKSKDFGGALNLIEFWFGK